MSVGRSLVPRIVEGIQQRPLLPGGAATRDAVDLDGLNHARCRELALHAAAAIFAGFSLLTVVDACAIAVAVPMPTGAAGGLALRLAHHVYDASETLALGAVLALVVGVFVRFARLPPVSLVGCALVASGAIAYCVLGEYLAIFAARVLGAAHVASGPWLQTAATGWSVFVVGTFLVAAPLIAADLAARPVLRFVPLPLALAALVLDQLVVRDDYMDIHGTLAFGAALVGGVALAPLAQRVGRALVRSLQGRVALRTLALFAAFGLVHPPPNETRFELFRQPCAVAPWVLATLEWRAPDLHAPLDLPRSRWLQDRSDAPAIAAHAPSVLTSDAVVVLITIDALRADVVADPDNDARFPTLARLKREGVVFTHAYAPGSQTELSFAALFSGRYYSEQSWTRFGSGWMYGEHPVSDTSPRFPELLADHGVVTTNYAGIGFLGAPYGVARGFREETLVLEERTSSPGYKLIGPLLDRLGRAGPGPLFLCAHLLDSHAPYSAGRKGDSDHDRYLTSIAVSDREIGRVLGSLERGFGRRWALIVSADHGEAFGEHQTFEHSKTLYDELLHVPLIAISPVFPAHAVDESVGLVDLGPTILDLYGVPTPAAFEGESLAPLLGGETVALTRPLIAEGRLRRALRAPDGLKVIDDPRRKVVEVYDLAADPGEATNVFDSQPARSDVALAELRGLGVHAGGGRPNLRGHP
jgi:hypothetical protein